MSFGRRQPHPSPRHSALFVGLTVGATGLTTGCGAPETGSLENTKPKINKPAPIDYKALDYSKIDYSRIDYSKIDYSKVDVKKLDPKLVDKMVTTKLEAADPRDVYKSLTTKLEASREGAVAKGDKELVTKIDALLEQLRASSVIFSDQPARW